MKKKDNEEKVVLEKIETEKKKRNLPENFYYILLIAISCTLIFSTKGFLSTINYLFVIIFAIVAVIKIINFIMDKKYLGMEYSDLVMGIMSAWIAIFIFKYGQYIFLEMLPVLVSLLLFLMAISSFIKYFTIRKIGNMIFSIASLIFGVLLLVLPGSIVYFFFKLTGIYILVMVILDFIDYKKNEKSL